jgi:amidase
MTAEASVNIDLETATVAQLRALLDSGRLTSEELTRAYLDRIEQLNRRGPSLNAIRAINPDALAEAMAADEARRGPEPPGSLLGIPVLIKDNIDVRGMPTTAGSVALARSVPAQDAPLVAGLRAAGAVILGKTNLTEFANFLTEGMPGGYSSLGGQVLNPYDASYSPSGSSTGSATAAAVGFAAVTIGTETSGSIISPAAMMSIVGIKPTIGLVSRTGIVPIASSQDTAGPMARTVADAAAALTAIAGIDPEDAATRANPLAEHDFTADLSTDALRGALIGIAASKQPTEGTDERVLWDAALAVLRSRGATLVEVDLDVDSSSIPRDSSVLSYEFKRDLNAYLARLPEGAPMKTLAEIIAYNKEHAAIALKFGQVHALEAEARDHSPGSTDTAMYKTDRAQDLADSKGRIDVAMKTNAVTAMLFANADGARIGARACYPSISVPAGYLAANRRPFNITFLGRAYSEPKLIGFAYDYEQASNERRPPSVINPSLFGGHELPEADPS